MTAPFRISRWPFVAVFALCATVLSPLPVVWADVVLPGELDEKGKKKRRPEDIPDPAPAPRKISSSVVRGQSVEITLKAVTSTRKPVTFLLRTLPQVGTVEGPFPLPRDGVFDQAKVIYRCPVDTGATADTFHYAARLEGGPISTPARIDVQLLEALPEMELPPAADFGDVLIGDNSTQRLRVRNTGTAAYSAVPEVPAPWYLASPGKVFEVPAGGEAELGIVFAPTGAGLRKTRFTLGGSGPKSGTVFSGTGLPPFSVFPSELALAYDPVSGARSGVAQISNSTDEVKVIDIIAPEAVGVARSVSVPARGTLPVPVSVITGGDAEAVETELVVRWQSHVQRVRLEAEPPPARLVVGVAGFSGTLVLPRALERSERRAAFTVRNAGGKPGDVVASATAPFSVREADGQFSLEPGASREVLVGVRAFESGLHEGTLRFVSGQSVLEVPVQATVVAKLSELSAPEPAPEDTPGGAAAAPTPQAEAPTGESALAGLGDLVEDGEGSGPAVVSSQMLELERTLAEAEERERNAADDFKKEDGFPKESRRASNRRKHDTFVFDRGFGKPRKMTREIPTVKDARLVDQGKRHVTIGWSMPGGTVYDYEFDRQRLFYQREGAKMTKVWVPHLDVEVDQEGEEVTARIGNLEYGGRFTFRLYTHDESRGYSYSTPQFTLQTRAMPARLPLRWKVVLGLLVVLAITVGYQKLKHRRLGGRKVRR